MTDRTPPPEADPTGENARWQATLTELERIRDDETETPRRRDLAADALMKASLGAGGIRSIPIAAVGSPGRRRSSGGDFLRTQLTEQGYN